MWDAMNLLRGNGGLLTLGVPLLVLWVATASLVAHGPLWVC
jgi:hypothetical protein